MQHTCLELAHHGWGSSSLLRDDESVSIKTSDNARGDVFLPSKIITLFAAQ